MDLPLVAHGPGFERAPGLQFDIERLRKHLFDAVIPAFPILMQGPWFGGWSVYSSNGCYDNGFEQGHKAFTQQDGKDVYDADKAASLGVRRVADYRYPTQICHGYLGMVMTTILEGGWRPRRARITIMKPGGGTSWHRDGADTDYAIRMHIPIVTNKDCHFSTRTERYHMPADGSAYIVRVNCEHQAVNHGDADRYHLIMNVWDYKGVTEFNRFVPRSETT